MPTGWGRGISSKPETRAESAEARRLAGIRRQAELKKLDRKGKTRTLARAIAAAAIRSDLVTIEDCVQAGFNEQEARDLFPDAIVIARRLEPAVFARAA